MEREDKFMDFEIAALRRAFTRICDRKNWKLAIDAVIPAKDFDLCHAAAIFIAGSPLEQVEELPGGKIRVVGAGYYACIGA